MNEFNLLCQARSIVIKAPRKNGELYLMINKINPKLFFRTP